MQRITLTHEINCTVDQFWETFFDRDLSERMFKETLGFSEFRILEQSETEGAIIRKIAARPKLDLPAALGSVVGSNFGYTEEGSFDKAAKEWRWKMFPSALSGKLRHEGTLRAAAIGSSGHVKRILELVIEAKVFGIGGLIESTFEKLLRDNWDKSAVATNKWLVSP